MIDIKILNAQIVNEGRQYEADIAITDGRIEKISPNLKHQASASTLTADGLVLLPGMIDTHVHFRQPGLTDKGDIRSESRAAVAGGITSFLDMPNTWPPTTTMARLEQKMDIASENAFANYGFYIGAAADNIDAIASIDTSKCCGIKVFMGASTGNLLVDAPERLLTLFRKSPLLIAAHCEDSPTIEANAARLIDRFGSDNISAIHHPDIRNVTACLKSIDHACRLAAETGARLHLLHLSCAAALSRLSTKPLMEKQITAEACVHHLHFTPNDYARLGNRIKCNPAIQSESDRNALLRGVDVGMIDTIGTDHAPHTRMEKRQPYLKAPSGMPLVQHALPALLEHVHENRFSLAKLVEKTSHAPARLFQIKQRGFIREGYWADLVLVNMNSPWQVSGHNILYKCGWSPFQAASFRSRIVATIVSGKCAYQNGVTKGKPAGKALVFAR